MHKTILEYTEENNLESVKYDDETKLDICSTHEDWEVKLRAQIIKNYSGNTWFVECIKLEGDKVPFLALFCSLNDYLFNRLTTAC